MSVEAFQTRARTIDHLGRGQIADCPTAVSELWKNAYDAYAKKVALHIFDGDVPIVAVTDNGHGMDHEEFLAKWLIVGTDAKVTGRPTPKEDRCGLQVRERQGEKGIGRLSVAFLGPVVFVISKRKNKPFVAALVDWRLFENPFLLLGDIRVPVHEFEDKEKLSALLPEMFTQLGKNIGGVANGEEESSETKEQFARVASAWHKYSGIQEKEKLPETAAAIEATAKVGKNLSTALLNRCLNHWEVWSDEASHGTALFVIDANHELAVWVNPDIADEDPEAKTIKENLQETLVGFVDPYAEIPDDFAYSVTVHKKDDNIRDVVSSEKVFTWAELRMLEHLIEGRVDENGIFRGNVKAFGRELGEIVLPPVDRPPLSVRSMVGAFDIRIGTFEVDKANSSMTDEQHSHATEMAEKYAGLAIYRDHLRVMPYGRALADYFGIEERRSKHHGREFWSYRRTFGRIAITRHDNPNLKDKAGREGLIDNQSKREFRLLVIEILQATARRFFGTDSKHRKEHLAEFVVEKSKAKEAEQITQKKQTTEFKKAVRNGEPILRAALDKATTAQKQIKQIISSADLSALVEFEGTLQKLETEKSTLKLPVKPAGLGTFEDDYRRYRGQYEEFCATAEDVREDWAKAVESIKKKPAIEEGRATATAQANQLEKALSDWRTRILELLQQEKDRIGSEVERDTSRFSTRSGPLIDDLVAGRSRLPDLVRQLEVIREALYLEFAQRYGGYLRVLEHLSQDIDIDALITWSVEQRQEMQGRVDQLHALAQLGVTVELVGHELETHDEEISRHLKVLPVNSQSKKLQDSIKALFDRLRFVTPLQLSGRRFLKEMTGAEIADYVNEFFEARFLRARVTFTATPAFRVIKLREYPARIYPVFINLINNSLYWVGMGTRREILLDVVGDDVVISDTGKGVDQDDVSSLFQLFFTRRTEGRGVGLYLCRANLAAGGHTIAYASDKAHLLLPGANFVLRIRGLQNG
jgi:signal transduction histidine kinase